MITRLAPADYRQTPWKNGGGVTIDIAEGDGWRFGRTPITVAGPFSDYTGFDRAQVLVSGNGLVLETPDGEIDIRMPFKPVAFAGKTPIVSRLENGAVQVVNLISERARVRIDLQVLRDGAALGRSAGTHLVYAADGPAAVTIDRAAHRLEFDHSLRIDVASPILLACTEGMVLVGSVLCV